MIGLAYRKRAILIAWIGVNHIRVRSTAVNQIALLIYLKTLISRRPDVLLVVKHKFALVHLRSAANLRVELQPKLSGSRGARRKHGAIYSSRCIRTRRKNLRTKEWILPIQRKRYEVLRKGPNSQKSSSATD